MRHGVDSFARPIVVSAMSLAIAALASGCAADRSALTGTTETEAPNTAPADPTMLWVTPAAPGTAVARVFVTSEGKLLGDVQSNDQGQSRQLSGVGHPDWAANVAPIALGPDAVAVVGDDKIVIADGTQINAYDERGAKGFAATLPAGTTATALATGYGNVAFAIDGKAGRVHTVTPSGVTVLLEDSALIGAQSALRVGGRLLVGTANGVLGISLAKPAVESVVDTKQPVLGFAVDDLGLTVVHTADSKVRTLGPDGSLSDSYAEAHGLALEPKTKTLLLARTEGVMARDYASLHGPARAVNPDAAGPFSQHGIALSGAEYWPNRGDAEADYPADILWGFYPRKGEVSDGSPSVETATPAAVACMEQSHAALQAWVATNPAAFHEVVALAPESISPRFYLWVNDYSTASASFPHEIRKARLWYWQRNPAVVGRIPGYWKWETTVLQDGTCTFPQADQAAAFLQSKLTELRSTEK